MGLLLEEDLHNAVDIGEILEHGIGPGLLELPLVEAARRDRDGSGAVMLSALDVPRRIADHHDRFLGKRDPPGVDRTVHGESRKMVPDLVVRAACMDRRAPQARV